MSAVSCPCAECIEALRSAFREYAAGRAVNQPRRRLYLETGSVLHALAGANSKYFGTKIYASNPKYGANFFFLLFDAATAKPLAQFDANYLGQIRTGAASGLAVDLLAPPDADSLAVIGSGFQARSQVEAVRSVRPLEADWRLEPSTRKTRSLRGGGRGRSLRDGRTGVTRCGDRGDRNLVEDTGHRDCMGPSGCGGVRRGVERSGPPGTPGRFD